MIKPGEYIQLLQFFSNQYNRNIISDYSFNENILEIETCKRFDELRIIHNKYKIQCENWNVYPNKDLTELIELRNAINEVCIQFKIRAIFFNNKSTEFKKSLHAKYFYEKYDITDLIVFVKERKESSTSH